MSSSEIFTQVVKNTQHVGWVAIPGDDSVVECCRDAILRVWCIVRTGHGIHDTTRQSVENVCVRDPFTATTWKIDLCTYLNYATDRWKRADDADQNSCSFREGFTIKLLRYY